MITYNSFYDDLRLRVATVSDMGRPDLVSIVNDAQRLHRAIYEALREVLTRVPLSVASGYLEQTELTNPATYDTIDIFTLPENSLALRADNGIVHIEAGGTVFPYEALASMPYAMQLEILTTALGSRRLFNAKRPRIAFCNLTRVVAVAKNSKVTVFGIVMPEPFTIATHPQSILLNEIYRDNLLEFAMRYILTLSVPGAAPTEESANEPE